MKVRHSTQIVCNPAVAKHIAEWNIITASSEKECPHYLLISAMVFMAFMLEGVINHLGELLVDEWDVSKNGKRAKGWLPFKERRKLVKAALGFSNESSELQNTISALFDFRDSFAHPKMQSHTMKEHQPTFSDLPLPRVGWQTLNCQNTEEVFHQINDYCNALLASGSEYFNRMTPSECQKRYGHCEPALTAAKLDLFLYSSNESVSTVSSR